MAEVAFTTEEVACFPQGPQGERGPQGEPGAHGGGGIYEGSTGPWPSYVLVDP